MFLSFIYSDIWFDKKFQLIKLFSENFSNDIGLFAPLFLNVVKLKPGEAMFLEAGRPHAYLKGTALEIMANSDNVLRAGLTPKNIDVGELVDNTTFVPTPVDKLRVKPNQNACEENFEVPVNDFKFSIFTKQIFIRQSMSYFLLINSPFSEL